jgi:hypothetical protein
VCDVRIITPSDPLSDARDGWMHHLVRHFRDLRAKHPDDSLVVVFDIDGTIIDTRHLVLHTLLRYDRVHGTSHFRTIGVDDIDVHEVDVDTLLGRCDLTPLERESVLAFYNEHLWSQDGMLAAHRPYRGVMEVIRWFQLQPRTTVALNTGRPESMRRSTIAAMNELGREYRVSFDDDLLLMNEGGWGDDVAKRKAIALHRLRARGHRIVAVVDNEPENLEAMAAADPTREVLFLHASTIFLSARRPLPGRLATGSEYALAPFVSPNELQGHVQLVWSPVTDAAGFDRFLGASIGWLGVPVRSDPYGAPEIGHRDDPGHHRSDLALADLLDLAADTGRSVRIDLHGGGELIDRVLELTTTADLPDGALWFSGELPTLGEAGIRSLRAAHRGATISCPVDFLAPLVFGALEHALAVLDDLRLWGVDRVGVDWRLPRVRDLVRELEAWGREVDIDGVDDVETLLASAMLLPRSVTADLSGLHHPPQR